MATEKVVESIEIAAPAEEVFALLTDQRRCLQLHPHWGQDSLEEVSSDYPREGSSFRLRPLEEGIEPSTTTVTAHLANERFTWHVTGGQKAQLTWRLQASTTGTRLTYEKDLLDPPQDNKEDIQDEGTLAREWLSGLKQYAELREGRLRCLMKWVMDRYLLKLRADQRRVIFMLIVLQLIMFLTFLAAAAGLGLVSLFL